MTNPVKLLSDDALREIEAHLTRLAAPGEPWESKTEKADTFQNVAARHALALCQTVRALESALRKANEIVEEAARENMKLQSRLAQVTQEPLAATIDILEQRRRQLGAESIPEYARTINFLQAIIDEKKKEYPPLRAARSNHESPQH